jgi:hypothetical protein
VEARVPRALSSSLQALSQQNTQQVCHLLTFTVGAATYRFAEEAVTHAGNAYQPHLRVLQGPRYSEALRLEPLTVELQNITLETSELLQDEGAAVQGQEATLSRLFVQASEALILFVGRISEISVNDSEATLVIAGELDPTAAQVPARKYSSLCVWNFQDSNCGYVNGVDPNDPGTGLPFASCSKDLLSCQARGRRHRFPGFLTITRELTETVEGRMAGLADERALSTILGE